MEKNKRNTPLWKKILCGSITTAGELRRCFDIDTEQVGKVLDRYPMRINPYYIGLIRKKNDAIYRQCVPDIREIMDSKGQEDPLLEEGLSPVPGLTHRYPDRVLFLVSGRCAVYCRFCNRKRKVGLPAMVTGESIKEGISYIRCHPEIRDVLLSGGDPLLLSNRRLCGILTELRSIPHVEILRIGTRVPCTLPQRVTPHLVRMLKGFHPLYIHTHFNHPDEITSEAAVACARLADAGIPLGCQTVLLEGVNNSLPTIRELMRKLLTIRVRPYYLFQADQVRGTSHFWTRLNDGLDIMAGLQGYTSGLCVPHFAIDLPGGWGKVPIVPEHITGREGDCLLIRDYRGQVHRYRLYESCIPGEVVSNETDT